MTNKCKLIIKNEVICRFENLEAKVRRDCSNAVKYFIPSARHSPSYKLGRWDGTTSFFAVNGNTFLNVLDRVLPIVVEAGYEVEIEDHRSGQTFEFPLVDEAYIVNNTPKHEWPVDHIAAGKQILLRDYQVEAINNFLQNPQSIGQIPTGGGKTIMVAAMSHVVEKYGRTMVIVPNKSLVVQTEADYLAIGLDVGVFYGERKDWNKKHTICTWQSLQNLTAEELELFVDDMKCVIVDECHSSKADVLKSLLSGPFGNIPIRWGLTGTIPKDDLDGTSLLVCIGPVTQKLTAKKLQDEGILAGCHIKILQLQDTKVFANYALENDFLVNDADHLKWLSNFINRIKREGNTLILVSRITTGKKLEKLLAGSVFVSGATSLQDRKEEYDEIATSEGKIIIASYGVAAVGINLPRIFNLVLLEPGKSFTRVIQSIGRGVRKAPDKDFVDIYDITSTCKYSARHLTQRKKYYKECEYAHTVTKIDYLNWDGTV